MDDYSRGLDMLRLAARAFAVMSAGIGYPVANASISTARVTLDIDSNRIEFQINPHFIHEMKDSDIAAVIAHETYHVLLGHLGEMVDLDSFPKRPVLIDAQECIINDGLPGNIGFTTIEGTYRGLERHAQDFSAFSTQEGYDFILNKLAEEDEKKDSQDDEDEKDGEGSSSSGAGNSSDSSDDDDSEGNDSGAGGSSDGAADKEPTNTSGSSAGDEADESNEDKACGGPTVTGANIDDMTDQEVADAVKKVLGEAVDNAIEELNAQGEAATPEIEQLLDDLKDAGVEVNNTPNLGNPNAPKDTFAKVDKLSGMNMKWVELLAIINPKLKDSGKPKFKDSWHAPRRRMLHSYPSVILPTRQRLDDPTKKGDSIPTFILALDMSGSIPERLLGDLASLAQSVPEELIRVFPITWSDNWRVFDPADPRKICARGGTRLESVYQYAEQVKREEGVDPYVLVITDGGFHVPASASAEQLKKKWYWMGIQPRDVATIKSVTRLHSDDSRVFSLKDFS